MSSQCSFFVKGFDFHADLKVADLGRDVAGVSAITTFLLFDQQLRPSDIGYQRRAPHGHNRHREVCNMRADRFCRGTGEGGIVAPAHAELDYPPTSDDPVSGGQAAIMPKPFVSKGNRGVRLPEPLAGLARRPVKAIGSVGRAAQLSIEVARYSVTDSLTGKLPGGELITQAWMLYKVTAIPAILMAVPFGAMVAVQISGLINQVGANSLVGAAAGVGIVRQGAPITAGLLMGGAAASAIASDLGARAIREELDAMRVLGISPVRRLVVPRVLALVILAPVLCAIIIASAVVASFFLSLYVSDVAPGTYWLSFGAFAKMPDVCFAFIKAVVFAGIVGIVSSLRGIEAKGGPRGVADAVNAAVVVNVVGIFFANLAITQIQTMFFPMRVA